MKYRDLTLICVMASLAATSQGVAQQWLDVAKGKTALLAEVTAVATIDANENALTLVSQAGVLGEWSRSVAFSFIGSKNKTDLLSKGQFTPAVKLDWRRGWSPKTGAWNGAWFYVGAGAEVSRLRFAAATGEANAYQFNESNSILLRSRVGMMYDNLAAGLGEVRFAIALEPRLGAGTSGVRRPQEICRITEQGEDESGQVVILQKCEDRIVGEPENLSQLHWRTDLLALRLPIQVPGNDNPLTVAVLGAGSWDMIEGRKPRGSIASGIGLFAPNQPAKLIAAIVAELSDFTNVGGSAGPAIDRMSVRLQFALPL